MEDGSEDGETKMKQKCSKKKHQEQIYADSEMDEPDNLSSYDGEILDIEDQEEQEFLLEAKKSYLKKALSGKSQSIIKSDSSMQTWPGEWSFRSSI